MIRFKGLRLSTKGIALVLTGKQLVLSTGTEAFMRELVRETGIVLDKPHHLPRTLAQDLVSEDGALD